MSIAATIRRYTSDSEPFVRLLHAHCRNLQKSFRVSVTINDYEARQLVKAWARAIENANHADADLNILLEEVVGSLLERLIEHGQIFRLEDTGSAQSVPRRRTMASYVGTHFYEYLAVQVGMSIVQEMLGAELVTPNPEKILDASVVIHTIPERAPYFASLLGLSSLIEAISNA